MAKARAIVKRRKAVRNIRKITKTMQMIATAKFQKSLKRAVGTKPYTLKVRELVTEVAASVGNVEHPLLRRPSADDRTGRVALVVITSNRGLAGAYNGSVLRAANLFIRQQEALGNSIDLYISGKKGATFFNFQKRPITQRFEDLADTPKWPDVARVADHFIDRFTAGEIDGLYVAYVNFISASQQKPEVLSLLPLAGVAEVSGLLARQTAEHEASTVHGPTPSAAAAAPSDAPDFRDAAKRAVATDEADALRQAEIRERAAAAQRIEASYHEAQQGTVQYDFSPAPKELLDDLLPLTVRTALFQCFLDAVTSENVARMVAMKSATDNADKMVKSLTMQYNRARQSQITTELSEIMGGVEAMKK